MGTQAKRAGPEGDRRLSHWARLEAAGPASPRLLFEEVNFSVGAVSLEAAVTLSLGGHRFRGIAAGRTGIQPRWKLAAAATVTAIQQYLHHSATDQPTPEIELRDLATAATGTGQQVIHVTVQIGNGTYRTDSLGSALVRNNWCSAAVAAALDASSRYISRVALASPPARDPPAARELELEQETPAASASASSQRLAQVKETASLAKPPLLTPHVASSAPAPDIALGIEVSPTSIRAAAVDAAGHILGEARRPSRAAAEPEGTLAMIREAARSALADLNSQADRVLGLGVAMPGRLRSGEGVCAYCGDFPAWREVPVTAPLESDLSLPVSLIGVTQAAALAETVFGCAKELSDVLFVRVGMEIDLAAILKGRQVALSDAVPGQAGHMVVSPGGPRCACGDLGCWQAVAARQALVSRVIQQVSNGAPSSALAAAGNRPSAITPALICQSAAAGDPVAKKALEETGRFLALGLSNLVALLDPEALILDSAPASVAIALRHAAETALKSSPRAHLLARCVLLSPTLGDSAPVLGAAAWAARQLS